MMYKILAQTIAFAVSNADHFALRQDDFLLIFNSIEPDAPQFEHFSQNQ